MFKINVGKYTSPMDPMDVMYQVKSGLTSAPVGIHPTDLVERSVRVAPNLTTQATVSRETHGAKVAVS